MKSFLILLSLVLVSLLSFGQTKKQRCILVLSVNLYTTTTIGIPCEKFEKSFKDQLEVKKVQSKDSIEMLDKFLDKVQYSKDNESLNARAQFILVNRSGKNITICIDKFNISVDGASIENSPEFYKYLCSLIPKKHLYRVRPNSENN